MDKSAVLNNFALIIDAISKTDSPENMTFSIGSPVGNKRYYYVYCGANQVFRGVTCVGIEDVLKHNISVLKQREEMESEFKLSMIGLNEKMA